jgi:zinc transport system substrate-binding protein
MKHFSFLFLALFLPVFAGCQSSENHSPSPEITAEAEKNAEKKLSIITSFYPLQFFTEQIAGDRAEVINLAGRQDPHSYKILPQDRVKLSKADLVIYQGSGLESWTEDVIPELQKKKVNTLEASHNLPLAENNSHDEEHDSEHDNHEDDKHEEEHDEHNHGAFDPHTWVDPVLAQQIAENITQKLIEIDLENKTLYTQNAQKLQQKLKNLDSEYSNALKNCSNKQALVSHNAFGYLEKRYGFELHPIAGLSPSDTPSAKLLAQLKAEAKEENITHVLTEENNVKKYAQTLSSETGLKMESINPMGVTPQEGDYFETSRKNIKSLSTAFGCQ